MSEASIDGHREAPSAQNEPSVDRGRSAGEGGVTLRARHAHTQGRQLVLHLQKARRQAEAATQALQHGADQAPLPEVHRTRKVGPVEGLRKDDS